MATSAQPTPVPAAPVPLMKAVLTKTFLGAVILAAGVLVKDGILQGQSVPPGDWMNALGILTAGLGIRHAISKQSIG